MKALLVIGDEEDWEAYARFKAQLERGVPEGFRYYTTNYQHILDGKLLDIAEEKVIVLFFFPFEYWNENIEPPDMKGIYGTVEFLHKFNHFWELVDNRLSSFYSDKKIYFVNDPKHIAADRDKELTKRILFRQGIRIPTTIDTRDPEKMRELIASEGPFYVKVRYGSMGKGITYLRKGNWRTNFRFENCQLLNHPKDYGWDFIDVTNDFSFLKQLMALGENITIEKEIDSFLIDDRKFDLRVYVCFGKVHYIFPRSNDPDAVIMNITQGAIGHNMEFILDDLDDQISEISKMAIASAEALKLNFAGVDILVEKGTKKPYILELNAFPGFTKPERFNISEAAIYEICSQKWD